MPIKLPGHIIPVLKNRTDMQRSVNERLSFTNKFLAPLREFLNYSFCTTRARSGFNEAVRYFTRYCFGGVYPNQYFNIEKALFSYGNLPPVARLEAIISDDKLLLTWDREPSEARIRQSDEAICLLFSERTLSIVSATTRVNRAAGRMLAEIPDIATPDTFHAHFCLISASRKQSAVSVYLGAVEVKENGLTFVPRDITREAAKQADIKDQEENILKTTPA